MKRILSLLGLVIIAAIGTFLLIPYVLSADTIRMAVSDQLEAATGRRVEFVGAPSLSVFPNLHLSVSGVTVANAEGMGPDPFVAMDGLSASLELLPLLTGRIQFDRLVMVRPRFNLIVAASGEPNWRIRATRAPEAKAEPRAEAQAEPRSGNGTGVGTGITFDEFIVRDGNLTYRDLRNGNSQEASSINATISLPAATGPLTALGNFVWRGEVIEFRTQCERPLALVNSGRSQMDIAVQSDRINVTLSGIFSTSVDLAIDGRIKMSMPSIRALARWFDLELPLDGGLGALEISSKFVAGGPKLSFSEAVLTLDGNTAEGAVIVKFGEPRPQIQATLDLASLNLDPYVTAAQPADRPAEAKQRGGRGGGGWKRKEFDLSGLAAVDADIRISAGDLSVRELPLGSGALTVALKDRMLTAQVAQLQAYDGEINGTLTLDGSRTTPLLAVNGTAHDVSLQPLFRDLAGLGRIRGTGDMSWNLTSSGKTEQALVNHLGGSVQIAAVNGAVTGMDLGEVVRTLRDRRLEGWRTDRSAETRFDRLRASYFIERGVASNDDLALTGPAVNVTGGGKVDLRSRQMDYRVIAALLEPGTGADEGLTKVGFQMPVIIRGPWEGPSIYPDPLSLIETVPGAQEAVDDAKEALERGDLKGTADAIREKGLNGLLDALKGKNKNK